MSNFSKSVVEAEPDLYFYCIRCEEYYLKTSECEGYNIDGGLMCEECEENLHRYLAGGRR